MKSNFDWFISDFEKFIVMYQYKKYKLNKNHYVFDIENSAIYSVLLRIEEEKEHIVVEEIFNDQKEKINIKKHCSQYAKMWISYFGFHGELGKEEPFKGESQYTYINKELAELEIDKRYDQWDGYQMAFAGFELKDGFKKGYAIAKCKYIDGIIELRNIGKELINAFIDSRQREQENDDYSYGESKYQFVLDKNMCEILKKRYFTKFEIPKMKGGFGISDLKGFWTFGFMRNRDAKPYEVLKKLKKVNFQDAGVINDLYTEKMRENMPKVDELFQEYFYVKVQYVDIPNDYREYSYLSDDTSIKEGDKVLVNRAGTETIAFVMDARFYKGYEVPFPVERTKYIIKKIDNSELEKYGFSPDDFDEYDYDDEGIDDDEFVYHYYYVVTTLSDNRKVLESISKELLEKRIIAGSQITVLTSSFWWNGKIESKEEYKLEVRTRDDKIDKIVDIIEEIHNYEVPEISSTRIQCLTKEMKDWIDESVSGEK